VLSTCAVAGRSLSERASEHSLTAEVSGIVLDVVLTKAKEGNLVGATARRW
jgi:hypothetical protein